LQCSFCNTGKKLQNQYKIFKISKYGIKNTRKRLAYFPENTGKRLSIDETALPMANSIPF
jgi:hypothetical protein